MKLIVTIANGANPIVVEGTCQLGEFWGDGRFDQPLVGDETLARIMHAWVSADPEGRTFLISGEDQHASLIAGFIRPHGDRKGVNILRVEVDDTTWLHSLDRIKGHLPYPSFTWEVELIGTSAPTPARQAQLARNEDLRSDPQFWVDEHSDTL